MPEPTPIGPERPALFRSKVLIRHWIPSSWVRFVKMVWAGSGCRVRLAAKARGESRAAGTGARFNKGGS